jgi:hypothetical protein
VVGLEESVKKVEDLETMDAAGRLYEETYNSFYLFVEKIFSLAIKEKYGKYVGGEYIKRSCDFLQNNKRTMYCGPRLHYKSLRYYCYIAWLVWKNKKDKKNLDIAYISYNQDLSGAHVGKLKELISNSFFFAEGLYDEYSTATSKAEYRWRDKNESSLVKSPHISINCYSILGALRGLHPTHILVDDFYTDEDRQNVVSVEPEIIKKINRLFRKVVLPMPLPGVGELHLIGTPQSYADLWYQKEFYRTDEDDEESVRFNVRLEPAITSYDWETRTFRSGEEKKALWPEMFSLKYLEEQGTIMAPQEWAQEFLVCPRSISDSFFEEDRIDESIRLGKESLLVNYADPARYNTFNPNDWFGYKIYGAYDPAKSRDPAHFTVFAYNNGVLTQLVSKFMDKWDYSYTTPSKPSQFKYIRDAVEHFNIQRIWGDNTNSVLTSAIEQGEIPGLTEVKITHSLKGKLAISLQKHLGKPSLLLLDDDRQKRGFLSIQNNGLKAIHSKDGHGEPLTSSGLVTVNVLDAGNGDSVRRIKIKTDRDKIPKMYKGYFLSRSTNGPQRTDLPFNNFGTRRNLMGRLS